LEPKILNQTRKCCALFFGRQSPNPIGVYKLLRDFREFARAYIDDIVIHSATLDEHIIHLRKVFAVLDAVNVSLSPTKSRIGYPSLPLLGQHVSALGLTTPAPKYPLYQSLDLLPV